MNEKLLKVQDIFLERISDICREFGLNNIMAQLYAILYLGDKPMSLNDMVERLKISKGSVSVNIRALERYGAVRRIWVKGSRRDYYAAEADISKVIMDRVKAMTHKRLSQIQEMLDLSLKTLSSISVSDKDEKESVKICKDRIDTLRSFYNKGQSLFNLFNSGLLNSLLKSKTKDTKEYTYASSLD